MVQCWQFPPVLETLLESDDILEESSCVPLNSTAIIKPCFVMQRTAIAKETLGQQSLATM
jgi:hypothetical protein